VEAIGVIGLGLMGSALAERFRRGGRPVVGFDVRAEFRDGLRAIGGEPARSVREVFERTRTILLSLPNSEIVAEVVREAQDRVTGATIIDTTTGEPEATATLGQRLEGLGAAYLDSTLTGSSAVARAGEVIVTAGGPVEVFSRAESLFGLFAKRWFHVGPWGSGARMKLVVNLVLGLNRAVLAEGLAFAQACGLNLDTTLEVLASGAAYSRVMDAKGRKMIDREFTPEAKLAQHHKDVQLILQSGHAAHAGIPFSELHARILAELVARGLGECDNSAVIRAFEGES
jgi:3-hydroxyisobutyrate dehydrogenase-like beta-hydroxyacid dehydrogenase